MFHHKRQQAIYYIDASKSKETIQRRLMNDFFFFFSSSLCLSHFSLGGAFFPFVHSLFVANLFGASAKTFRLLSIIKRQEEKRIRKKRDENRLSASRVIHNRIHSIFLLLYFHVNQSLITINVFEYIHMFARNKS